MEIKMEKTMSWAVSGIHKKELLSGEVYDMQQPDADIMINNGYAKPLNPVSKENLVVENKAVDTVSENKFVEEEPKRRGRKPKKR